MICINFRRRSVTIREILQKKKNKFVKFHTFGKKIRKIWKIEKWCEKKCRKIWKRNSPIKLTLIGELFSIVSMFFSPNLLIFQMFLISFLNVKCNKPDIFALGDLHE